jgi:formate transporter
MSTEFNMDALVPAEMAKKAVAVGVKKSEMRALTLFALAILAGAFIAMGGIFSTTIASGSIAIKDPGGAAAFATGFPYGLPVCWLGWCSAWG